MWQRLALIQVYDLFHLTKQDNSNSAFASADKLCTALLILEMPEGWVYFASWGKTKYMVLHGRIRTGSDWSFSKILRIRTGSDSIFAGQDCSYGVSSLGLGLETRLETRFLKSRSRGSQVSSRSRRISVSSSSSRGFA